MTPTQYLEKASDLLRVHPDQLVLELTSKYLNNPTNTGHWYAQRSSVALTDSFITPFYFDVKEKGIEPNDDFARIILKIRGRRWLDTVHSMCLSAMPGCCGVLISHGVYTLKPFEHKGINNLMNEMRIDIAQQWGYSTLLCTDVQTNTAQRKTLGRNGWKDVHFFDNKRTKHPIAISVKEL